jgi:hypothetical protein
MTSVALLAPVMMPATTYTLRVTCNAVTETLTFTSPQGYGWMSGDGQASSTPADYGNVADALELLETCLETHSEIGVATVSLVNHRVQVTHDSLGTLNLLWADGATTLDGRWFGWTTASTGATSGVMTAPNQPQGWWLPGRPVSEPDSRVRAVTLGGYTEALSGRMRVSHFGSSRKVRTMTFRLLPRALALAEYAAATAPYGTFEHLWSSLSRGRPVRFYPSATALTSSDYTLYHTRSLSDPLDRDPSTILRWAATLELGTYT